MEGIYVCVYGKSRPLSRFRVFTSLLLLTGLFLYFFGQSQLAAQSAGNDAPRRIRVAIKPEYSDLAKRLSLSGVVRVEVQISADGKVKKAHVVGGHPVLALDAEKAAMLTEFEPGPKETTQIIEFHIGPKS